MSMRMRMTGMFNGTCVMQIVLGALRVCGRELEVGEL
jgi:hypothetical protein